MIITIFEQYGIATVGLGIASILIIRKLRKKGVDNRQGNISKILKKHDLKNFSDGIVPQRFLSKIELEETKKELLPFGFTWDENKEKFTQTGGLSSLDAQSVIDIFDIFDARILKLEKTVLGNPERELPKDIKPLLDEVSSMLSSFAPAQVTSADEPIKVEDISKKIEMDLNYFTQPRTTEEIVEHFKYPTKQGLYMKLTAFGLKRNAEGNYYLPEKN